tara:strand:- start:1990 stop:2889 length:900 start_codon:yes stop_codon:yes gene_type:complete
MKEKQSTNHIFMVEPAEFYMNPQTLESNHYQIGDKELDKERILNMAIEEFKNFHEALTSNGVSITALKGIKGCPDHIFPNWFITFENKSMQIFSMMAENRRKEKTPAMIEFLKQEYELTDDLSHYEEKGLFLESTSSMVFDRVNRVVYATSSPRTNPELTKEWCNENKYELVLFETQSHIGEPIYHTDVLMYVGTEVIGICFEVIKEEHRGKVREMVNKHHEVIEITKEQIMDFCGNSLEVKNSEGDLMLVMSKRAYDAYKKEQIAALNKFYRKFIYADLSVIERFGGGSARCMLSELF